MLKSQVIFISLLFRILHSLNHIQFPLFMLSELNIAILRPFLCFYCLTRLIICLNHKVIFISLLFRILHHLNHIQFPLFMLSELNIAILRPFLCFHCLTRLIICLNHKVIFISLLFKILHSLNHIQFPLFMLSKLNIAILRPFLCFHCLTRLIICLNHELIFISLLYRILHSLNHILFMLSKVNFARLRQFLCFDCLTKLIKCFNHKVMFISLLFRILHSLNHIQLPLFMLSKVNIAILRPFVCFHCLTKLIVCLNHEFIFISLLFRILHSLNHIQLPLFTVCKVNIAISRPFLCFLCLNKLIISA